MPTCLNPLVMAIKWRELRSVVLNGTKSDEKKEEGAELTSNSDGELDGLVLSDTSVSISM